MAKTGRTDSLRLLETAFEAGITHYDVARLYGYGEAESVVGNFLAGRPRDEVTVTTKLGIDPPRHSRRLAIGKALARRAVAVAPPLRRLARKRAEGLVKTGRFGPDEARLSLETSLRELKTDYVDFLLLHECTPEDISEDLLMFLRDAVSEGSIRSFGIATGPAATRAILTARKPAAQVVQLASGIPTHPLDAVPHLRGKAVITHSALGNSLDEIHGHLIQSRERATRWSEAVGTDCSDRRALGQLLLAWASLANSTGIVLFSSRNPATIKANAGVSLSPGLQEQVERLESLVRVDMGL